MIITAHIGYDEVQRRWALGEIDSTFFVCDSPSRENIRSLLESKSLSDRREGTRRFLELSPRRYTLRYELPSVAREWFLALLPISRDEFESFRVDSDPNWGKLTDGTYRLVKAATNIRDGIVPDARIAGMARHLTRGPLLATGITLDEHMGFDPQGLRYTVLEGNGRLTALYMHHFLGPGAPAGSPIEIVIGRRK